MAAIFSAHGGVDMENKPKGYRLRTGRFSETGRIYLVTTVVDKRVPVFQNLRLGRVLVKTLKESQPYASTMAYVVMPDHLHWLMQLGHQYSLSTVVANVKSISARRINQYMNRTGRFWQCGFHDHALRCEEDIQDIARYVVANPLRAGIVNRIEDYSLWDAAWL